MRLSVPALFATLVVLTAACSSPPGNAQTPPATTTTPAAGGFHVEEIASGLEHGWDIGFLPGGAMLVTQRPGGSRWCATAGRPRCAPTSPTSSSRVRAG